MKDKFEVGDRVAVCNHSSWGPSTYRESRVAKLYASGNFVLEGSKQQYRPGSRSWGGDGVLEARAAGPRTYYEPTVILWDEAADKVIAEARAEEKKRRDFRLVQKAVEDLRLNSVPDGLVAALAAALKKYSPSSE